VRQVSYGNLGANVDLVAGGPPCQPFSLGGKHGAFQDARDMFPEAVRAVRELRPKCFMFENVKGLLRESFSSYFNYIILQLTYPDMVRRDQELWKDHLRRLERLHTSSSVADLSYRVVYRLLNAADYGVPQFRHRVFIVGFRADLGCEWSFPSPTHSVDRLLWDQWVSGTYWDEHQIPRTKQPPLSPRLRYRVDRLATDFPLLPPAELRALTVRDALRGLPAPGSNHPRIANHEFRGNARAYPGHTGSQLDEPSKAIKAGDHGVPGGENMMAMVDGSCRYFTAREGARIQTFPDDYAFSGSWTEAMRQIGNAVPVKLAETVGHSIFRQAG
jgi:DNA (cytosine-5)-methyltransferase 1